MSLTPHAHEAFIAHAGCFRAIFPFSDQDVGVGDVLSDGLRDLDGYGAFVCSSGEGGSLKHRGRVCFREHGVNDDGRD